jgi:hypothetical protein
MSPQHFKTFRMVLTVVSPLFWTAACEGEESLFVETLLYVECGDQEIDVIGSLKHYTID